MSDYFRDVRVLDPDDVGDVRVDWGTPHGGVLTVWIYARHHDGTDGALAAATELHARLTSPLLDPLPEGVEWVRRAPAARVRELGWEWWDGVEWRSTDALSRHALMVYVCRPPQAPQVTVGDTTLPADASDEDIVAAFRAAGGAS